MQHSFIRFWLYASLLLLPLTVAFHIRTPGHLLDEGPLYLAAIPFGLALGAFYARFSHCWGAFPGPSPSWGAQLYQVSYLSILATLLIGTLFRCFNIGFDQSAPQNLKLSVLHQHVKSSPRGRGSSLQLVVLNPFQKEKRTAISVSEPFYIAHPVGSPLRVKMRRGALGAAWIEPLE